MAAVPIILGQPLTIWAGLVTFVSFLTTAGLGFAFHKGLLRFPFRYHIYAATTTLILAIIHVSLVVYLYYL